MKKKEVRVFLVHFIIIYIVISFLPFNQIGIIAKPFYYVLANLAYSFIPKTIFSSLLSLLLTYIYLKSSNKHKK